MWLHFANVFLRSATLLAHSMWSHLSLALTVISSFVFLVSLPSQPRLFFLFEGRQRCFSVTVLVQQYPGSQQTPLETPGFCVQLGLCLAALPLCMGNHPPAAEGC